MPHYPGVLEMIALFESQITHPILKIWLRGTTCYNYWIGRSVLFENDEMIVLKHNSHASYCDRFSGSKTCAAYALLLRKDDMINAGKNQQHPFDHESKAVLRWDGRISKKTIMRDCATIGVNF